MGASLKEDMDSYLSYIIRLPCCLVFRHIVGKLKENATLQMFFFVQIYYCAHPVQLCWLSFHCFCIMADLCNLTD